jgi:3-deoxy-7-phosphoheptulonate synthase
VVGGLPLKATPGVVVCVLEEADLVGLSGTAEPLCDPRLNADQARLGAAAWPGRPAKRIPLLDKE